MKTERNPENTRHRIIQAAFQEIHKHGYQGMRIDQVWKNTGLKKGAMYHHFPSKQALAYAVLEERIQKRITEIWIKPLENYADPLEGIHDLFVKLDTVWSEEFFNLGCPLNNLAQEMSPINEGFRERIEAFFKYWKKRYQKPLREDSNKASLMSLLILMTAPFLSWLQLKEPWAWLKTIKTKLFFIVVVKNCSVI